MFQRSIKKIYFKIVLVQKKITGMYKQLFKNVICIHFGFKLISERRSTY